MNESDQDDLSHKKLSRGIGTFLCIGTSVALIGGFVVAKKPEENLISPEYEPPTKFALRALRWATLLTLSSAFLVGGAVCWYLDVRNIPEFSVRMKQIVSPISSSIDKRFPKSVLNHQYGVLRPGNEMAYQENEERDREETNNIVSTPISTGTAPERYTDGEKSQMN